MANTYIIMSFYTYILGEVARLSVSLIFVNYAIDYSWYSFYL